MKTPFKCPVCGGNGLVPNGFYDAVGIDSWTTSSPALETCRTCNGSGIVWTDDSISYYPTEDDNLTL